MGVQSMEPPDDLTRRLSLALETAIRAGAQAAPNPLAFIDALDAEFARTVTSEHFPNQDHVAQLRIRASLAAAFSQARTRVRSEFTSP
jgi:hypothetical protein